MSRNPLKILFAVILILSGMQSGWGCICEVVPPPCYNYSQYETVFVGTVKTVKTDEDRPIFENVEIEVEQNFKGMGYKKAFTGNYPTSCSWTFEKDGKFLFYGNLDEKKPDHFGTGYCTRTAHYEENLIDLDFLRQVNDQNPVYWVWGSIFSGWYDEPFPGIKAQVYDNNKKLVGTSDESGNIKVVVSKEGQYKVLVFLPKGSSIQSNFSGSIDQIKRWQSTFKRAKLNGGTPFVEFNVEVKPNHCGWFHLKVGKVTKDK